MLFVENEPKKVYDKSGGFQKRCLPVMHLLILPAHCRENTKHKYMNFCFKNFSDFVVYLALYLTVSSVYYHSS